MFGKKNFNILFSTLLFGLILILSVKSYAADSGSIPTLYDFAKPTPTEILVAQKDTDLDGISDKAEGEVYKTNPSNPDTDSDGVLDYQEILDKTNPLDANSNAILQAKNGTNILVSKDMPIVWYVGRIAGIGAFIMFTLVMCMGLLMTSKFLLKFRFLSAPNALELHSFNASYIALALMFIHFVAFMFDEFIKLSPLEIFVPFLAKRDYLTTPMGFPLTMPLALGVISAYLALALILTSQFRKKIPTKLWRTIHYSSFLFYCIFLIHGFIAGTDSKEHWMRAIYIMSFTIIASLILLRIFGKKYFLASLTVKKPVLPSTGVSELASPQPDGGEKDKFVASLDNSKVNPEVLK